MLFLRSCSDIFEQVGIDEAYLDISRKVQGSFDEGFMYINNIKNEIKNKIGLSFSAGIGPNKLIAKMAADYNKPNGITVVKPDNVKNFLKSLPVIRIPGVGKKTAKKLNSLGINTIEQLAKYDIQKLIAFFGRNLGIYFHNVANGVSKDLVHGTIEKNSISRISTLKENTRNLTLLLKKTDQLISQVHKDFMDKKLKFKRVEIIAVMTDLSIRSKSKTLNNSTNDINLLKKTVKKLIELFLNESEKEIRRIGVKISKFTSNKENQKQLHIYF